MRSGALVAMLVVLAASAGAAETTGTRHGLKPIPPSLPKIERTYGLLTTAPVARVTEPGKLVIEFETAEPTPPVSVYYGLNTMEEELDYPRYRWFASEDSESTEPRTAHRIEVKFGDSLKYMPNTPYEPRICWRAEVFFPMRQASRFVEGRVYFDPGTKGDTVNVTMGPEVEQVTTSSAIITFETDRPTTAAVVAGGFLYPSGSDATRHEVLVDGLEPGLTHAYTVLAGETRMRPYQFETAGTAPQSFTFAAMVDSREGVGGGEIQFGGVEARSVGLLTSQAYFAGARFILFAGDLINGYTTSVDDFRLMLRSFRQAVAPVHARIPIYESMGNHEALHDTYDDKSRTGIRIDKEGADSAEAVFADTFTNPLNGPGNEGEGTPPYAENVYTVDYGNARFILLNNNYWWSSDPHQVGGNLEGYILPKQMEWLKAEVARADADPAVEHIFYAAQEPPFPNGGHTADAMWYKGGDTNRDNQVDSQDVPIVECRNTMWEIIASTPKSVAFITGDEHAYSRLLITPQTPIGHKTKLDGTQAEFKNTVWQVTSGGAGAPWYDKELDLPWSQYLKAHSTMPHCALFTVTGGDVELKVRSQVGQTVDTATLRLGGQNTGE